MTRYAAIAFIALGCSRTTGDETAVNLGDRPPPARPASDSADAASPIPGKPADSITPSAADDVPLEPDLDAGEDGPPNGGFPSQPTSSVPGSPSAGQGSAGQGSAGQGSAGQSSVTQGSAGQGAAGSRAVDDDSAGGGMGPLDAGAGGAGGGFVMDASVSLGGHGGDIVEIPPYEPPREGSFKVLGFSKTNGFRTTSIPEGQQMLEDLAAEYGFEVDLTEDSTVFTAEGLSQYELVFFLNTSGDVLNDTQQEAFETWILDEGAFVGTHRAADTENGWTFYYELIGQYYDLHASCCLEQDIEWTQDADDFPGISGLPSPWTRAELWFYFDSYPEWSSKAGFRILATTVLPAKSGEGTVTVPVSFVREWGRARSFYTVLGHQQGTFTDDLVRQHILGGMLWTVRREHWLD